MKTPCLTSNSPAFYIMFLHLFNEQMNIIAHQIQFSGDIIGRRMKCKLRRRQPENEPATANINAWTLQNFLKKFFIRCSFPAVNENVYSVYHFINGLTVLCLLYSVFSVPVSQCDCKFLAVKLEFALPPSMTHNASGIKEVKKRRE